MASIFSKIVSGDIPAQIVYRDDQTLAFLDINPAARGHTLVIPTHEYADLWTTPPELLAAVAHTSQKVALAIRAALNPDGLNIIQNNGAAAGQTVFHYHVHIIPRWQGDAAVNLWHPHMASSTDLQTVAEQIRQNIA